MNALDPQCGCSDCEAAVSPAAYLTALLDYALKHVRNNKAKIDLPFLVDTFHQPFIDLPTDCGAVERELHQVRICIEVLRSYLGSRPLADAAKEAILTKAEGDYRFATYAMLLGRVGTSYEEIRRVRVETRENRRVVADRLGIDLTEPRVNDELDQLFLDLNAKAPLDRLLSEQTLENIFGLADTTRDPLSSGAKLGDVKSQITRWNLEGVLWGQNTDPDGFVYVSLTNTAPSVFRIELHQDSLRKTLIASGETASATGTMKIVPEPGSRLSGVFEIVYTADSTAISIAAVPALLSWQSKHLRAIWSGQDYPGDAYTNGASPVLPIIDPDLIGPDDFRNPAPKASGADKAFDLWLARRQFVDTTQSGLRATRETKGLDEILKQVLGNPIPDLDSLLFALTRGGTSVEIKTAKDSIAALSLSVESFTRLLTVRAKDQLGQSDPRNDKVGDSEWLEVYSILTQALKNKKFASWRAAEAPGIELGLQEFWLSVTEPKEGDWPPTRIAGRPLLDPDLVKLTDLPDWLVGRDAINLWNARKAAIAKISTDLNAERSANGLDATLRMALGHPSPGSPLQHDPNTVLAGLGSTTQKDLDTAADQITTDFHLTIESFKRLMAIKAANDQADPAKKPVAADWAELVAILAPARKIKHAYPSWIAQEPAAGLVYWKALKAKLPLWRAAAQSRQAWQQALRSRSQSPSIDPALMGADDLQRVVVGDAAFDVWKERFDRTTLIHSQLRVTREAVDPDAVTGLDRILHDALGFGLADLVSLDQERQTGHSIEKRSYQLNLPNGAFDYLIRIQGLAAAKQPIVDVEWETVYSTLTQAKIRRESASMRLEEADKGITLGPDWFKIPKVLLTPLPFLDPSTPRWLSTWQARRDWQDELQSRIDQSTSISQSLEIANDAVEEALLPVLRDALIAASDAAGINFADQAEWITARLLTDARSGGCRMTTRVAQAVETLQSLLFDLRSGQFKQLSSPLSLVADYFDEEWQWMGSYGPWRAAIFVRLYPENIIPPSLLKAKSPAFSDLITNTRSLRLSSTTACQQAEAYSSYFRDICSLEIEATCQASTIVYTGAGCERAPSAARSMFYMFARATSGKLYWSAYDPNSSAGQTFWLEAPGFDSLKIVRVIGATPYRRAAAHDAGDHTVQTISPIVQSSYIHLFCITDEADKRALKLARLNLDDFGAWDDTINELPIPPVNIASAEFVSVQTQDELAPPGLVIRTPNYYKMYYANLNTEGVGWESVDWPSLFFQFQNTGSISPAIVRLRVRAALRVNGDMLWLVTSNPQSGDFDLDLIGLSPADKPPSVSRAWGFSKSEFLGALPGPESAFNSHIRPVSAVYIFWRDSSGSHYRRFSDIFGDEKNNPVEDTLADLIGIPPTSGSRFAGQQLLIYQRDKNARAYYMYEFAESGNKLVGVATIRAVPRVQAPLNVPIYVLAANLQKRRQEIATAFTLNADAPPAVLSYLREAYYFVPMHLASGLQSAANYLPALDCFRTVYDYESPAGPPSLRNIYFGLDLDAALPGTPVYQLADGWLLNPLDPHSIAATRQYAYTRFTIMAVIRCLLDFADAEFTQDDAESLPQARTLYLTALDLLRLPELHQMLGACDDLIAELQIQPGEDVPPEVPAAIAGLMDDLTRLAPHARQGGKVAQKTKEALETVSSWTVKLTAARAIVQAAAAQAPLPSAAGLIVTSRTSVLKEQHALLLTLPSLDETLQRAGKAAVAQIFSGLQLGDHAMQPGATPPVFVSSRVPPSSEPLAVSPSLQFCVPPNPVLQALRLHAELNIYKLRTCRNIAGLKREVDPYSAPTDTTSGMPSIGPGGQLVLPGVATIQPSLYRYPVLMERAKQLVQLAAQMEGAMLSALERRDTESQSLLLAKQQLSLAQAGLKVQDLQVTEAKDGVGLVDLQQQRAQIQIDTYGDWIQTGANEYENQMISGYQTIAEAQNNLADVSFAIQEKQSVIASAQLAASIVAANPYVAAAAGVVNLAVDTVLFDLSNQAQRSINNRTADVQVASVMAALERRQDEWALQKRLAEQDSLISEQQKTIANDHVQIATQERVVAGVQADNAKDSFEFLKNKFTNLDLFDWMSNVLEGVYRFFLQQATAMAKLAENQLAFERQEVPPTFIKSNYWEVPTDNALSGSADSTATDRKGLTGSARLLQDIYQLDQYAFSTNKRKLALNKTFSLAQLAPVEFERFLQTGVLPFSTPMELFDLGFPGHYLRLIKRVRTSVVALIPPVDGIHASLSTTGPSRVVIGGDIFQTVVIKRTPEYIAMSSPSNSTGVLELDPQADMLLPFEGSGVDMNWEFNMPKAANQLDYRAIADVLVTLEYTALNSSDYRQQVIQSFRPTTNSDRPFSLRNQFPDQWYDLHNPEQTSTPMTVRFTIVREDFPPNIDALKIQQVLMYFISSSATPIEVRVSHLNYTAASEPGTVGGSATSIDGIISTRRGNAASWTSMLTKSAVGEWEFALPDTDDMRSRFTEERGDDQIDDILLVLTYSGRTPAWPA